MKKVGFGVVLIIAGCFSSALVADVRSEEKTRIEFGGMLGRMVNMFGGKGARDGITSSVAVKGDRKARLNDTTGQVIDLAEEKVYDLDMKRKTYKVTTFGEFRRRMEEAQKKAAEEARKQEGKAEGKPEPARSENEKEIEIDVDIKNTGQQKTINGFSTSQSVMIVTLREKGKTLDEGGGMVVTTDTWLAPKVAALDEVRQFDMRYAEKLYGPVVAGASAEQMSAVMAFYPMMKDAMGRVNAEGAKLEGTAIMTTMTMEAVKSDEQMAQEAKQKEAAPKSSSSSAPASVGGLLGGFAKKAAEKKASGGGGEEAKRATFMTSTTEVLKLATNVSASEVAVPAGFKENR